MPSITRKAALVNALSSYKFKWRSLTQLGVAAGLNAANEGEHAILIALLADIGARPARGNNQHKCIYGLVARVGERRYTEAELAARQEQAEVEAMETALEGVLPGERQEA